MLMKDFLLNVVRTPELLKIGYEVVLDKLRQENCRLQTRELLVDGSFEYVTVLTQNVYQRLWPQLPEAEKQQTRLTITQAVLRNQNNRKYMESLAIFASKLHNIEGYEEWSAMYRELLVQLQPQSSIEYFLVVFRESDDRISVVGEYLLPYLYNMLRSGYQSLAAAELQKIFLLVYLLVRSLSCLEECNPELVRAVLQQPLEGWMTILMNVLSSESSVALQKYTAKTLTSMLADMPQLCSKYLPSLVYPVWMLFNRSIVRYLNESRNGSSEQVPTSTMEDKYLKEIRFEENTASQGLVYQLVELMNTLLCTKGLEILQRLAVHLVFNNFYNLLLITAADEKGWLQDENRFITEADDEQTLCLRNQITRSLMDFVELNPETLQIIRNIIENGFSSGSQEALKEVTKAALLSNIQQLTQKNLLGSILLNKEQLTAIVESSFVPDQLTSPWTRREAAILLIYYNADELFEDEFGRKHRQTVLSALANLIADTNQHPLLRIQALRTLTKCSTAVQPQQHIVLLGYCLELLNSTHAGMRIMGVRSIGSFVNALRSNNLNDKVQLTDLQLNTILEVGKYLNGQTMHILLETCVALARANPATNQQLARLIQPSSVQLLQTFFGQGLLFSNMLELFGELTIPSLQCHIAKYLVQGSKRPQHSELRSLYIQLLKKYVELHTWASSFSEADMLTVVKCLLKEQQASGLVRQYLRYGQIDQQMRAYMCSNSIESSWVVPALKRGIPVNAKAHLALAVNKILQVTSQHQLECQLVLPLFLLYQNPAEHISCLKEQGLFTVFLDKLLKYMPLFQGQMLKRSSILTLMRLNDPSVVHVVKPFVVSYMRDNIKQMDLGDLNWEDDLEDNMQDIRIDDDDWLSRRMTNEGVQQQLREDLPEVASIDLQQQVSRYTSL